MERPDILFKGETLTWVVTLIQPDGSPLTSVPLEIEVSIPGTLTSIESSSGTWDCTFTPTSVEEGDRFQITEKVVIDEVEKKNPWTCTVLEKQATPGDFPPFPPGSTGDLSDLGQTLMSLGPKRFKTKDIEVEAHDPLEVNKLKERTTSKAPASFCGLGGCYVVPERRCKTRVKSCH